VRRAFLVVVLLLLLAAPLVVAFRDVGRLVTAEAMRLAWLIRLFVEGLPQLGLWVALLALIVLLAVRSLAPGPPPTSGDEDGPPAENMGQVWELSRWITQASLGEYACWTLHRRLEGMAWEAMAARRGSTAAELRRRFRAGDLALDADIAAFLEAAGRRHFQRAAGPWAWLRRLLHLQASDKPSIPSLERIVAFVEEQMAPGPIYHNSSELEVEHAHDDR
jgi:hypothetical protein